MEREEGRPEGLAREEGLTREEGLARGEAKLAGVLTMEREAGPGVFCLEGVFSPEREQVRGMPRQLAAVSTSSLTSSPTSSSPGGPRVKLLHHRQSWADNTGNSSFRVDSTEEEREGDKDDQEKEEQDTSHEEDEEEGQGGQEEKEEEEASSTSSPGQLRTIVIDGSNIACLHGRQKTFSVKGLLTSKLILRPTFSISLSPFHHLRFLEIF